MVVCKHLLCVYVYIVNVLFKYVYIDAVHKYSLYTYMHIWWAFLESRVLLYFKEKYVILPRRWLVWFMAYKVLIKTFF